MPGGEAMRTWAFQYHGNVGTFGLDSPLHGGTPRPLGGDQVRRQLHLGQAARQEQPAVVGHDTNARPPRAEQRRDAIGNRLDLDVDLPHERRPQRMAHLVQTPDLCPATFFGVCSQRRLVRIKDLDTMTSHLVAQARGVHRLLAGRKDGVKSSADAPPSQAE